MVMMLQLPYSKGNLPGCGLIRSQERLCSQEVGEIMNIFPKNHASITYFFRNRSTNKFCAFVLNENNRLVNY